MTVSRTSAPPLEARPAQTEKFLKKREAILHASARLFDRDGLKGATFADIAQSVGMLTHSITYYYRRKEDLAAACLLRAIEATQAVAAQALKAGRPEERIRAYLSGYADLLAQIATGAHPALVSFNDIRALPAPQVDVVFAAYTDMLRSVRRLLPDEGDRVGRNARAHLLLSLGNGMRGWIGRYETVDYMHAAGRMSDILIGGLARDAALWREQGGPELGWPRPATGDGATPDAFLRAATAMVNEQGYRGASLDKIAARLNLTKGSFYHHYASKDELIAACFERTFDVVRQTQALAMERRPGGWDRLSACSRALVRFQMSTQGPLLRTTAWNALPADRRAETHASLNRLTERFGLFIVDAMIDGATPPLDPSIAAQMVAGMINAASELERWAPGITEDSAVRLYVRPLFLGLLTPEPFETMKPDEEINS